MTNKCKYINIFNLKHSTHYYYKLIVSKSYISNIFQQCLCSETGGNISTSDSVHKQLCVDVQQKKQPDDEQM